MARIVGEHSTSTSNKDMNSFNDILVVHKHTCVEDHIISTIPYRDGKLEGAVLPDD
jgi:hypothetical protein